MTSTRQSYRVQQHHGAPAPAAPTPAAPTPVAPRLPVLENEHQARVNGRAFAKQIFGQMQWKRIGSKADESAKLYESVANGTPSGNGRYTVRAVRHVAAQISEVEVVLATSARYGALAVLLQNGYSSGGAAIEYGQVLHQTGEREHVSVEFASLRPYTSTLGMENHMLLNYSLATMLQRSRKTKSGRTDSVSVPSVLHLLRPVDFPAMTKKRRDFQREYLSLNDFSITYIIQESSKPGMVTLEVVLTCTDDAIFAVGGRASAQQRKGSQQAQRQRMWQDALSLTRINQLIENYRESRNVNVNGSSKASSTTSTAASSRGYNRSTRASTVPGASSTTISASMSITSQPATAGPSNSSGCCICHKKFGPFRWKHHCEICEHAACDRCLSVIANPTAMRKKKRVCNNCLYGVHALGAQMHQQQTQAEAAPVPVPVRSQNAHPAAAPRRSSQPVARAEHQRASTAAVLPSVPQGPPAAAAVAAGRRSSAPQQTRTSRSACRASPPPVPEYDRSSKRYASRASRVSSSSAFSDSEDDDFVYPTVRARRAQTVTIDEVQCKPVAERTRSFRMAPSYRSSYSGVARPKVDPLANLRLTTVEAPETSSTVLYRQRLNFHHLNTLEADYELDFHWLNIFPKAPVHSHDAVRIQYLETTLKMDPQSIVFLRHDSILEKHAHRVLDVATQWHGCSINVASKTHVYCLINASSEMDASTGKPAVVVDDVMPREESASSYAVYHNAPFFVPELASDDRFHAHPLYTDHDAISFLSFPLYAASSSSSKNQVQCIGTLDLWKLDHVAASSHVSQEWWQTMEALVQEIGVRVEDLARESSLFQKPRTAKAYSVDTTSSCDSRGSTWRDGSFELDLFDLESDINTNASPPQSGSVHEDMTTMDAFYVKGRSLSMASLGDSRSWKYTSQYTDDSDCESTTSSCSNSSRTSRSSRYSHRYSAADLHSTIESLLHQANETSSMIYNTGVQI